MKAIYGIKIGMSQVFTVDNKIIPVTLVKIFDNHIGQVKTTLVDGYQATQIATIDTKPKTLTRSVINHLAKHHIPTQRFIREIRDFSLSAELTVVPLTIFQDGEFVDVIGTSKGKGFSGSIKRHNYQRGPMSHGSKYHRGVGSLGAVAPGRVFKATKLPGRMGGDRITMQNLQIIKIDLVNSCYLIKGAIPGNNKSLVMIRGSVKKTAMVKPIQLFNEQPI